MLPVGEMERLKRTAFLFEAQATARSRHLYIATNLKELPRALT